jgi:hypothetical protein
MTPGQVAYFICYDTVAIVKLLDTNQHPWAIELDDKVVCVQEETLTTDMQKVLQHIDKRIEIHESKIAVLKACRQEFKPLRITHE